MQICYPESKVIAKVSGPWSRQDSYIVPVIDLCAFWLRTTTFVLPYGSYRNVIKVTEAVGVDCN